MFSSIHHKNYYRLSVYLTNSDSPCQYLPESNHLNFIFHFFFFSFFFMQNDGGVKSKLKLDRLKEWTIYMMKFHQCIIKIITVYNFF